MAEFGGKTHRVGKMAVETPMLCMPIHQNWTHPESKGRERNYVHGVKGRPR